MILLWALREFCRKTGIPRARIYFLPRMRVRIRVPLEHVDLVRRFFRAARIAKLQVSVRRLWPGAHDDVQGYTAVYQGERL